MEKELDVPQSQSSSESTVKEYLTNQQASSSATVFPPAPLSPILSSSLLVSRIIDHPTSSVIMSTSRNPSETPATFNMNTYSSVTKLQTGTFNHWKLRLTTVLGAHRLSKYILREVDTPIDQAACDDYDTNCMRALAAIHATVDAENFEVIRNCLSPRDAFVKLCEHQDDAGGLSTAHLFSDLVTLRLSSDGNLKEHIHQFRKIHNDLLSNLSSTPDIKISEPFIAIILINSLPPTFTPLVQSLLTSFESLTLA